jgi:hypothetical protein
MLAKACKNAAKMGTLNVEFRYSYWNRNTVI